VAGVFAASGLPAGLLGTVVNRIGGEDSPVTLNHGGISRPATHVPRHGDRGRRPARWRSARTLFAQDRAVGIQFEAAVFTNLTRDHLDYHADLDDYFAAKRRLFLTDDGRRGAARAIVNVGDEYGRRLADDCRPAYGEGLWTFAVGDEAGVPADARALDLDLLADGSAFTLLIPRLGLEERITLRLAARFNVENALAAATAAWPSGCRRPLSSAPWP